MNNYPNDSIKQIAFFLAKFMVGQKKVQPKLLNIFLFSKVYEIIKLKALYTN